MDTSNLMENIIKVDSKREIVEIDINNLIQLIQLGYQNRNRINKSPRIEEY